MSGITLIAGLGNPGAEYENNRHNAGFWFVDALAHECGVGLRTQPKLRATSVRADLDGVSVWLFKPNTYMNESGSALQAFVTFYKIEMERVLVVHDEIDFPVAQMRLKRGGGHGGHNGLRDIIARLGADFWRLRIGVGHPGSKERVVSHVLGDATADEAADIRANFNCARALMPQLVHGEFDAATHALHAQEA